MNNINEIKKESTLEDIKNLSECLSIELSAAVSRLQIYMKEHGAAVGIRLCQSDGTPYLVFDPGLGCADMNTERWQIANNMMALLIDATDDLKYLIVNNLINLPCLNGGGSFRESIHHG